MHLTPSCVRVAAKLTESLDRKVTERLPWQHNGRSLHLNAADGRKPATAPLGLRIPRGALRMPRHAPACTPRRPFHRP